MEPVMKRTLLLLCIAVTVSIALTNHSLFAQSSSAQISGIVLDSSGAAIPGAAVKLVNEQNAGERTTITNQVGSFVFPSLPPGTYDLSISAQGFRNFSKQ